MPSSRIKGITIEIGGDTKKLEKALSGTNKELSSTQKSLKDVERLLKMDPGNTELLAQKQRLLGDAVSASASKLRTLKDAAKSADDALARGKAYDEKYRPLREEIEAVSASLDGLLDNQNRMERDLASGKISTETYDNFQQKVAETKEKLDSLKQAQKELDEEFAGAKLNQDQYDALQREIAATEESLKKLKTEAGESFVAIQKIADIGGKIKNVGDKVSSVGTALLPASAAITGIGIAGVNVAADFEKAMSGVAAITMATDDEFERLRETAVELGASTAFSSLEVAEAMTEMAKAGWDTTQIIDGMSGVLDAAAASGESLGTVSTIIADAITGFGLSAKDSGMVADLLTQAANSGTIGIADLGESYKYIAPVAKSMNISIQDVTTALSAMSMAGIKASQAGTSLRTLLANLVRPTDSVSNAIDALNLRVAKSDGSFRTLDEIVASLRVKMADLTDEAQGEIATNLAGKEGMSGLIALLNLSQDEYDALSASMENSAGVAQETAEIMQDNLQSKTEQLTGALESLAITLADFIIPALTQLTEYITGVVDSFTALDPATQKAILSAAGVVAALGPVLTIAGKLLSGLGSVLSFLPKIVGFASKLGPAFAGAGKIIGAIFTGPVGIVAGCVAAVAGLAMLYEKNETFRGALESFDAWVTGIFAKDWTETMGNLGETANGFFAGIENIYNGIKQVLGGIVDLVAGAFAGDWERAWQGVVNIFEGVFNTLGAVVIAPFNVIIGILNTLIGTVEETVNWLISGINKISIDIPDWIPGVGGKHLGFEIDPVSWGTIPYLAQGTVTRANSPFLAVVGDNPNEPEVISPYSTIKRAAVDAMAELGGGFGGGSVIDVTLTLDGTVLARKQVPYLDKEYNRRGGSLIRNGRS